MYTSSYPLKVMPSFDAVTWTVPTLFLTGDSHTISDLPTNWHGTESTSFSEANFACRYGVCWNPRP